MEKFTLNTTNISQLFFILQSLALARVPAWVSRGAAIYSILPVWEVMGHACAINSACCLETAALITLIFAPTHSLREPALKLATLPAVLAEIALGAILPAASVMQIAGIVVTAVQILMLLVVSLISMSHGFKDICNS